MRINIQVSEIYFWFNVNGADSLQWRHIDVMASQISGTFTLCSTVCSGVHQRKHQSSAPLTGGLPAQRASNVEMFPLDDVIMFWHQFIKWSDISQQFGVTFISNMCVISQLDVVNVMKAPCLWWDKYSRNYMYIQSMYICKLICKLIIASLIL